MSKEQIEKEELQEFVVTLSDCQHKYDKEVNKAIVRKSPLPKENKFYARYLMEQGYRKMPDNIGDFSDGYHTFNELYHHRAVLFSVICNMFPDKAWKSKLHDTGDMFEGMFIVGIETEHGQATYHYDIEPYWDMFKVKELEKAPKWDGHTPSDAIERIGNLPCAGYRKQSEGEWREDFDGDCYCTACGYYPKKDVKNFCPNCGAIMKGGRNGDEMRGNEIHTELER